MRSVVLAYGAVGHAALEALLGVGAEIDLVVTHEDSPDERIWFPSVADRARAADLPVFFCGDSNRAELLERLRLIGPDFLISVYFREMLSGAVLSSAKVAALNLHGSLLPRYRGRCPVNWVLVNGESETGVTLHHMDEKPDHGDIVAQRPVAILPADTALSLTLRLAEEGRNLLSEVYPRLLEGKAGRFPQAHGRSSYFGGRRPADGRIDWSRSAEAIRNLVRAVAWPWPGAFTEFRGTTLSVWDVATHPGWPGEIPGELRIIDGRTLVTAGEGAIELLRVGRYGEPPPRDNDGLEAVDGLTSGERLGLEPAEG